jgi:hypothetical protein
VASYAGEKISKHFSQAQGYWQIKGKRMIGEYVLYILARLLYNSQIAHNKEMKESLKNIEYYDAYRKK